MHMQRYVQKPDWTIGKLNVEVPVPSTLDLSALRATGLQPGETAMAEDAVAPAAGAPAADAATIGAAAVAVADATTPTTMPALIGRGERQFSLSEP